MHSLTEEILLGMEKVIHRSENRGFFDNGWLKSFFSFSFANYYDPHKINFGALRVLNCSTMEAGEGIDAHPCDNMEIIFIPTEGAIDYGDNMGHLATVPVGSAQIINAGTGVIHYTYNHIPDIPLKYFLIWIYPREYELMPFYSTVTLEQVGSNRWQPVVSPEGGEHTLRINQDAWIYMADVTEANTLSYAMHSASNGAYVMVSSGCATICGSRLWGGDAIGITGTETFNIKGEPHAKVLLIEVPIGRWNIMRKTGD